MRLKRKVQAVLKTIVLIWELMINWSMR